MHIFFSILYIFFNLIYYSVVYSSLRFYSARHKEWIPGGWRSYHRIRYESECIQRARTSSVRNHEPLWPNALGTTTTTTFHLAVLLPFCGAGKVKWLWLWETSAPQTLKARRPGRPPPQEDNDFPPRKGKMGRYDIKGHFSLFFQNVLVCC